MCNAVEPPSAQCLMWCASQAMGGRLQPGKAQCWSRATRASQMPRVMSRLVPRTVVRRLRRTALWNGNQEAPLWTVFTDPEHVVRWSWRTWARIPVQVGQAGAQRPDLPVVVLRRPRDVRRWLAGPLAASLAPTDVDAAATAD